MRIALVLCLAGSLGACASITRGTGEQVAFQSEPPGAEVRTSTGLGCPETPCSFEVPRKDQFIATFTKPGYHPEQIPVSTRVSGGGALGLAGNAVVGGLIGVVVDASTGASMDHDPKPGHRAPEAAALGVAADREPPAAQAGAGVLTGTPLARPDPAGSGGGAPNLSRRPEPC